MAGIAYRAARRNHLRAPEIEERVCGHDQRVDLLLDQLVEGGFERMVGSRILENDPASQLVGRRLQLHRVGVDARAARIDQHADHAGARLDLQQQFHSLDVELRRQPGHACGVAARPVEAGDQAAFHRVCDGGENDRDGVGGFFRGKRRYRTSGGNDHPDIIADQLSGKRGKPVVAIVRCAIFDRDGLAFDVAGLGQPTKKSCSPLLVQRSHRAAGEKTDNRKRLLLRAERQRRDQGGRKNERR